MGYTLKVLIKIDNNKVILIFPSPQEATFFYNYLRSIKTIESYEETKQDPTQLIIKENTIDKYIEFLKKKPTKPVTDPETIRDYVNSLKRFIECSNGIINSETILKCIKNKHYATAIRNYLHMLYYYGRINKHAYQTLLEKIPRFRERSGLARDKVPVSTILISLAKAQQLKHYAIYKALFYSGGARLEQLVLVKNINPKWVSKEVIRFLVKGEGTKPGAPFWIWLPTNIYNELKKTEIKIRPKSIARYFNLNGLTSVTLIRSFCWQTGKQLLGHEIMLTIQGRVGELSKRITARSYDDLIYQADMLYPKWKQFIDELMENATIDKAQAKKRAKQLIELYKLLMPI